MGIVGSFNDWIISDKHLTENVQAAKQYMLKRFAKSKKIEVSAITPEDQAKIFANEDYKRVLELVQVNPGFTSMFVKFRFDHNISIEELAQLFEKIKANDKFLAELSMPIIEFPNQEEVNGVPPFEALMDEFNQIETRRKAKWIINVLPGDLRRAARELPKEDLQRLYNAATIMNNLGDEVKIRLIKKAKAFTNPMDFVQYTEDYAKGYLNSDVQSKIDKLEDLEPEGSVIYADERYLMLSARTEKAQKELCSIANWCINRGSFNDRQYAGGAVQINTFDFGLPPTHPNHLIGTTISYEGNVTYSHDINDSNVRRSDDIATHFKQFGYPDRLINTLIRVFPMESAIKKLITELSMDKKQPIEILEFVIKSSYQATSKNDIRDNTIVDIITTRMSSQKSEILDIYMKYGIMSILSAKLFNSLLGKSIDEETKSAIMEKTQKIFGMLRSIQSNPKIFKPNMENSLKAEPEILALVK
jgi:hypothetical protein